MIKRKILTILFTLIWWLSFTMWQYFEFTWNSGNWFQQWCYESYGVFFNTEWVAGITVWEIVVSLDGEKLIYNWNNSNQSNLFLLKTASSNFFKEWTDSSFPRWLSNYNKVRISAQNPSWINWHHEFWNFLFTWMYAINEYPVDFVFSYDWSSNYTTLSKDWTNQINSLSQNSRLTGTIIMEQKPCLDDINLPSVTNTQYSSNINVHNFNSWLTLNITDNNGDNNVPYVYTWWYLQNWTWNKWNTNNQYGVDLSNVSVSISWNHQSRSFSPNDFVVTPNWKTWQYNDKNYTLTTWSDALFDFWIEEPIKIIVSWVRDRAWNQANSYSITFNNPQPPYLQNQYPANWANFIPSAAQISFVVKDDWAWVDKNSIVVTLQWINWTEYNTYVFSGSDLNVSLNNGAEWLWNSWWYKVIVTPIKKFPANGEIRVTVNYQDLKWNTKTDTWSFTASPDCSELACCSVDLLLWENGIQWYQNEQITISGWNPSINTWLSSYTYGDFVYTGWIVEINCNMNSYGLTLYSGHQNDINSSVVASWILLNQIYLSWDNNVINAELSWQTLILSLKINDIDLVWDYPSTWDVLNTWNVNFVWHVEWSDDYSRISGYVVEIYSGWELYLTGNSDWYNNTWLYKYLPDWEYEWWVYAFDGHGNKSAYSDKNMFVVDTTAPTFDFENNSWYECVTWELIIINANDSLIWLSINPYSFDWSSWSTVSTKIIDAIRTTWTVVVSWYVKDIANNISEKVAIYEFIDTWVSCNDLYVTWLISSGTEIENLIDLLDAREWACGTWDLSVELVSCVHVTGEVVSHNLRITELEDNFEWTWSCVIKFSDDERNIISSTIEFKIDTKAPICEIVIPSVCTE